IPVSLAAASSEQRLRLLVMPILRPGSNSPLPARGGCALSHTSLRCWMALGLLSLALCASLVLRAERSMNLAPGGVLRRGDAAPGSGAVTSRGAQPHSLLANPRQFQKIEEKNGQISAEYGCLNFNNDALRVSYAISNRELAAYKQGYGYEQAELDALGDWQKKALDEAYRNAVQNRLKQDEL